MDKTIKISFLEGLKKIFGFEQNDEDISKIEKEVDKIRAVSDGISWETFNQGNNKKEQTEKKNHSPKKKEIELNNIQVKRKTRTSGGIEIEQ